MRIDDKDVADISERCAVADDPGKRHLTISKENAKAI